MHSPARTRTRTGRALDAQIPATRGGKLVGPRMFAGLCALASTTGCPTEPKRLGDLPECDAGAAAAVCFEDEVRRLEVTIDPLHVLAADFTGDENLEVLAAGVRDGPIGAELWAGSHEGPVGPPVDAMVTGCSGYPVSGALLLSGRDDLMVSTCSPRVDVYAGGDNGFAAPVGLELAVAPRSSVIVDVEGDGDVDLVMLGDDPSGGVALSVLAREADASLAAPTLQPVSGLQFDPAGIRAADFDGDGLVDLAIFLQGGSGALGFVRGAGAAAFSPAVQLPTELEIHTLAADDFDGDGDDDLAFADSDARFLCIWIVDVLADPAPFCWPAAQLHPTQVAAGDIDDDGDAEVVVGDGSSANVWIWDVDLGAQTPALAPLAMPAPADLVVLVDLQGDGRLDLLAAHFDERVISLRLAAPR